MVYANLKAERARAGLTQERAARLAGVTASTMCRYERGDRDIPSDVLVRLSDAYGCSVDYLLGRTEERRRA